MQQTLNQVADWLQMKVGFTSSEFDFFMNGKSFCITEEGADEPFAVCTVDSQDRLMSFEYIDPDDFDAGKLKVEDMTSVAEAFIREFHPDGLKTYRLQSVIDLDELYLVEYGIRDERYGLVLPGIGFSLTITSDGKVVQFSFSEGPADIRYPEHIIPEEEAKEIYAARTDFDLEIRKTDTEIFHNGDNTFRLVWSLKEAAVDIPADGSEPDSVAEGREYETLPAHVAPVNTPLHGMIGITDEHVKLGEHSDDGLRIEKWQHLSLEKPDEIDFREAYASFMITIHYDSGDRPVFVYNGEEWTGDNDALGEETLMLRAFDYLFELFTEAQKHFLMEKLEEDEEWDELVDFVEELTDELDNLEDGEECMAEDDEWVDGPDEAEEEESKEFYFQYHVNGVPVEGLTMHVSVGLYSGRIVSASMESALEIPPADTLTVPVLTKQEAAGQLMQQLKMELSMSMEFDEDGQVFYRLTYYPSFPKTNGHVRMIDAENGTAYYMDAGGSVFY
ncbi:MULTISPECIES: DUF4901 domain-containing protein [unclassified Sporosarcina]|uniref:DUF4901 domain-containing protein n=1 Tax=unclassified Sporosarcina TaxID=2647733 RepID=UPI00203B1F6E|nr:MULTISPECIES: DUF4901 domain-containing protein [unclassified Sporosarcina]GKV67186.1 hypothetical protein NCCP2331_33390 [Sporosarcina sp. NCCP-2331]GLB57548.1 hypothetical protein NCCP2378_33370 [Sporosarcina sp. NCCP-2378]